MSNTRSRQPGPAPIETAELIERLKQRAAGAAPPAAPRATEPPIVAHAGIVMTGRLVRHGAANYAFRSDGSPSYYIEIATAQGSRILWGVDLKRALTESQTHPQVGELIGVQRIGYQVVTPPRVHPPEKAKGGIGESLRRTRWRIERVVFFAQALMEARRQRESLLKDRDPPRARLKPAAPSTSMQRATEFAERHIRHPDDREQFLAKVEAAVGVSVAAQRDAIGADDAGAGGRHKPDRDPPVR